MSKPEWGTKRICLACNTRFYDLSRDPIVCPKCGTVHDPEAIMKSRRGRSMVEDRPAPTKPAPKAPAKKAPIGDTDLPEAEVAEEEAEGDELIEDTSDLGEDDDDMAEVIENVDDEEER